MQIPYTPVINTVLRDPSLSLSCKGLYAMIYSYAGLPSFQLTFYRLKRACSSSTYTLRKAWRDLKASGYLQHYYTTSPNGVFSHAYDIHQDMQIEPGTMRYTAVLNRPNGDLKPFPSKQNGNYTAVCNSVLRDKTLTLQTKGLYAVLTYLFHIPNFTFRLHALAGLCKEKTKALASAWNKIKLCGLLKQHRHPCGTHNQFQYTYDLLHTPDIKKPYFTNHRADGSITLSLVAQSCKDKLSSLTNISTRIAPPAVRISDTLQLKIDKALAALSKNKKMKINGIAVSLEARKKIIDRLTPDIVARFQETFRLPEDVRAPIPYIASSLYQYAQQLFDSTTEPASISHTEILWVLDMISQKVSHAQTIGSRIAERDAILAAQYRQLNQSQMSLSSEAYEQQCRVLFDNWKKNENSP